MDCVCQVAVPVPLHQYFDYRWPFEVAPQAGMLVDVPFGRRQVRGVVVSVGPGSGDPAKLKSVSQWFPGRALVAHQLELAAYHGLRFLFTEPLRTNNGALCPLSNMTYFCHRMNAGFRDRSTC